jgi:hypothetical protein
MLHQHWEHNNKKIQASDMEDKNEIQTKWSGTINKICQKQV